MLDISKRRKETTIMENPAPAARRGSMNNTRQLSSRYIQSSDNDFTRAKRRKSQGCTTTETKYFPQEQQPEQADDQRQDSSPSEREGAEANVGWTGFAATVKEVGDFISDFKDLYCQGTCFVQTSTSMDSSQGCLPLGCVGAGRSPRLSDIAAPTKEAGSLSPHHHERNQQPIHFPSLHLEMDDWDKYAEEDGEDFNNSAYFDGDINAYDTSTSTKNYTAAFKQQQM